MRPRNLLSLFLSNKGKGFYKSETSNNTIYVYDVIVASDADAEWFGGVSAESFVKQLAVMTGPVTIRINSPGGDVFGGQAIYNAIKAYPDQTIAYVDGWAASAASTIAIAADKTIMAGDGAMMMIHKAWTWGMGNADELRATSDILDKIDTNLARQYATKSGKASDDIMAFLNIGDTYFSAAEALEYGLADEVAQPKDKGGANNAIAWDMSVYSRPSEDGPSNQQDTDLTPDHSRRARKLALLRAA